MDIRPYMAKHGYSRRASNHVILERDGKLWLAYASQGAAGFMASGAQAAGLLEISLCPDGKNPVPYEFEATESKIEVKAQDASLTITIDKKAGALRFKGAGATLRLDAKEAPQHVSSLNTPEGVELTAGGGRYLFAAQKGRIEFDDTWLLSQFHSITPVLDVIADGGKFELAAYDLPAETAPPAIVKTVEECAEENRADFASFCDELVETSPQWTALREKIAYLLWIGHRANSDGAETITGNKLISPDTEAWLLAAASLAFRGAAKRIELITAKPVSSPPVHAYAAMSLIDDGLLQNLSRAALTELYAALLNSARKWEGSRVSDVPGLSYYAYRFESGIKAPKTFSAGEPAASPDLSAYLTLQNEALAAIAEHIYDGGEAVNRRARAKEAFYALLGNLWDGENFTGMNVYTREKSQTDDILSLMPLVLGKRLPGDIADKLSEKADGLSGVFGVLAVMGLFDSGKTEKARNIAADWLKDADSSAVECPFYGAALLALAAKCAG